MTLGSDGPPAAARPSGPGRASKLVTLEDAAALVPSGGLVAIGGLWFQNNPSRAAWTRVPLTLWGEGGSGRCSITVN